ncbi:hypothetical protein GN244_ATG01217 [Phytophthora infestans]|uniref:Secreted RxLR effector peptide protein n=1 Tax=Phytophthora infestans TaxID=4787 RepID=A0A833T2K0_PHYIN|nr:hypothetical protein GN244_ATG01217 [Phytophthora infestans]
MASVESLSFRNSFLKHQDYFYRTQQKSLAMMRLFSVVLLVVAAFLACAAEDTTSMRFTRGYLDEKDSAPVQRLLRAYDNGNDEERAPIGNALNSIVTSTSKAIDSAKLKVFLLKKSSGDVV